MIENRNVPRINYPFLQLKLLLFLILTSLPGFVNAQWENTSNPSGLGIQLKVVNEDTVFYSEDSDGKIYRTFDGAETWLEFQTEVLEGRIEDFDFPTDEIGYACGSTLSIPDSGFVLKTIDGGVSWERLPLTGFDIEFFSDYGLYSIKFLNADTGFVNTNQMILRTEDGGANFTPIEIEGQGGFGVNELTSNSDGVIFVSTAQSEPLPSNSDRFSIFRSANFGESWQEVYSNTQINVVNSNKYIIREIHFPTSEVGYAVGGSGRFLKTTDAGLTWSENFISPFYKLSAVFFTSNDVGYINNDGGIYKTIDGGDTWANQNVSFPLV